MFLIVRVKDTTFHIKSLERFANSKDSGAAAGSFWGAQQMYNGYMYWQTQMSIGLTNFENGLKSGWVPGR